MPRRIFKVNVARCRRDNYVYHFEHRKFVQSLSLDFQDRYRQAAERLPMERLNEFGVGIWSEDVTAFAWKLSVFNGLDFAYLSPWYCSEVGWANFQRQWAELPEFVHMVGYAGEGIVHRVVDNSLFVHIDDVRQKDEV